MPQENCGEGLYVVNTWKPLVIPRVHSSSNIVKYDSLVFAAVQQFWPCAWQSFEVLAKFNVTFPFFVCNRYLNYMSSVLFT